MKLTEAQIEFIREDIRQRGIELKSLEEDLLDHICCAIEEQPGSNENFEQAYRQVLQRFGKNGLRQIQSDTIYLLTLKQIVMRKTMFVIGYIAAFLSTTGLLFKLQHWPGAAIMLTLGVALLNFGFFPMYFYDRYKQVTAEA